MKIKKETSMQELKNALIENDPAGEVFLKICDDYNDLIGQWIDIHDLEVSDEQRFMLAKTLAYYVTHELSEEDHADLVVGDTVRNICGRE